MIIRHWSWYRIDARETLIPTSGAIGRADSALYCFTPAEVGQITGNQGVFGGGRLVASLNRSKAVRQARVIWKLPNRRPQAAGMQRLLFTSLVLRG